MAHARRSVLFVALAPLQPGLTGPLRRTVKLAEALAEHCEVTLAAPSPSVFPDGPFRTLETGPINDQRLAEVVRGHDVVVVQTLPSPRQLLLVRARAPRLVYDMIAPGALEIAEIGHGGPARDANVSWRVQEMIAHLRAADLVLCNNDRQRDLALGAALGRGSFGLGPSPQSIDERIVVVPYGIEEEQPRRGSSPLREAGIVGDGERVAVWGSGLWSWLDPLTAIRAVETLRDRRPDLRLVFVGFEHPDAGVRRGHESVAAQAMAYSRDRGLDGSVIFKPGWHAYDDYLDHLLDADVGLSLHYPSLEGRYASRTRVLDYLHAGLPVICTTGEAVSDLVAATGRGSVIPPLDIDACAAELDELTRDGGKRLRDRRTLEPLYWRNAARPLVEYCLDPSPLVSRSRRTALALAVQQYPAFLRSLYRVEGTRGLVRAAGRRVTTGR